MGKTKGRGLADGNGRKLNRGNGLRKEKMFDIQGLRPEGAPNVPDNKRSGDSGKNRKEETTRRDPSNWTDAGTRSGSGGGGPITDSTRADEQTKSQQP